MIYAIYLGFLACFWLGRCYEAERQESLRRRGTMYRVRRWNGRASRSGSGRLTR